MLAGEGAFLDLYQQLSEAPDPAPALAAALEAETQLAQLTAQVNPAAMAGWHTTGCTNAAFSCHRLHT